MTIKHLVISGGGPIMIQVLGALQHLEKQHFIDLNNIETIYGTSSGGIIAVLICLGFDWDTINDYILQRPWQDVFPIKVQNIFDAYSKKGIFDIHTIEKCFKPLFDAQDISLNITLEDFYKKCKVELHFFSFELNDYIIHDISHLTHPYLSLMSVIQMTCGLPILVTPVCIENKCYVDGGIICNYPLNYCISSGKNPDEILGFKNNYGHDKNIINNESTMFDYLIGFLFKAVFSLSTDHKQPKIKHEVICNASYLTIDVLRTAISSVKVRQDLLNHGIEHATDFLLKFEKVEDQLECSI